MAEFGRRATSPSHDEPPELPPAVQSLRRALVCGPEVGVFCDRLAANFVPEHGHHWLQLIVALDGASCEATWREPGKSAVQTTIAANQIWIVPAGVRRSASS